MPSSPGRRAQPAGASAPSAAARCLIVEDHQLLADLLANSLAAAPDLVVDVVGVTHTVAAAIAACNEHQPDLVLLDLGLPDGSGLAVAEHLAATLPAAQVIVVSGQAEEFVCPPALQQCIRGVVNKADPFTRFQVILTAVAGPSANGLTGRPEGRRLVRLLSKREREVLTLIGTGLSSKVIAEKLGVSLHTVNAHRKNIARKLGVAGTSLMLLAHEYRRQLAGPSLGQGRAARLGPGRRG